MPSPSYESIFVARQPIFKADDSVWGYELLFRSGTDNVAGVVDDTAATSSVIADGLTMALEGVHEGARCLINFPENMLLEGAGFALPKETCVIEILETVRPTKEALAAVRKLHDAGYTIAVDDYFGQPELAPFIEIADIIKIDILELNSDPARIKETLKALPHNNAKLLAEKVEDNETFDALKALGFSLFQGFFFSKPVVIPGRKLSSNQITKLQLLSELSSGEFEPDRLAEILRSDPNLSYRLFRYINSVGFGMRNKVTSLKRAIDMMGMLKAKQWLRTVVMADMNTTPRTGELAFMAVQRAKFLESICSIKSQGECYPDIMFICGLFSLLDAMLGIEMQEVLDSLPLDAIITDGLLGEGDIRDYLRLAHLYERGLWYETGQLLRKHGLDMSEVDVIYKDSWNWAQHMLVNARHQHTGGEETLT